MSRLYRVHEFAELAGVTVKALHHYDRLGLLRPRRTDGGYRIYLDRDLERLEQIIALKFLGLPLQQIKAVLDHPDLELPDTLRLQREALEEKREHLNRAIRAIRAAEEAIGPGKTTDPAMLKRIIQVIDMQNDIDQMKKYYSTDGEWEKRRRYYEEGPSREWKELYRDIDAALGEEPGGDIAQGLADRWLALGIKSYSGDTEQQTDSITAWMDRAHWPPSIRDRVAEFNLEKVHEFMREVALCSKKKYFSDRAWIRMQALRNRDAGAYSVLWQMRVDLFRDIESCLDEDPGSDGTSALALRWMAYLDAASGGDSGVKDGLMQAWADRAHWTATIRWMEEGLSMMNTERFDKAADFIDRAVAEIAGGQQASGNG